MEKNSVPIIRFMFKDEFSSLSYVLKLRPDYGVEDFSSADDVISFLGNAPAGLIIASLKDREDLIQIATFVKSAKAIAKDVVIKIVVVDYARNPVFEKALNKLDIQDVIEPDVNLKGLRFKIDFWIKSLNGQIRNIQNLSKASSNREATNQEQSQTFTMGPPLEHASDIWLTRSERDCKKILGKWVIRLLGPGANVGQWVEVGSRKWRFDIKEKYLESFLEKDSGTWFFKGDVKPVFIWKENLWLITGDYFHLYLDDKKENYTRLELKNKEISICENSSFAKNKLSTILETFDKKHIFKQENEILENMEGKGNTSQISDQISGKNKTSEEYDTNLTGETGNENVIPLDKKKHRNIATQESSFWKNTPDEKEKSDSSPNNEEASARKTSNEEISENEKSSREEVVQGEVEARALPKASAAAQALREREVLPAKPQAVHGEDEDIKKQRELKEAIRAKREKLEAIEKERAERDKAQAKAQNEEARERAARENPDSKEKDQKEKSKSEFLDANQPVSKKKAEASEVIERPKAKREASREEHEKYLRSPIGKKTESSDRDGIDKNKNDSESAKEKAGFEKLPKVEALKEGRNQETHDGASALAGFGNEKKKASHEDQVKETEEPSREGSREEISKYLKSSISTRKKTSENEEGHNNSASEELSEKEPGSLSSTPETKKAAVEKRSTLNENNTEKKNRPEAEIVSLPYKSRSKTGNAGPNENENEIPEESVADLSEKMLRDSRWEEGSTDQDFTKKVHSVDETSSDYENDEEESDENFAVKSVLAVEERHLDEITSDARILSFLVQDKVRLACKLDDFFEETLVFVTDQKGIIPSSVVIDLSFKLHNKSSEVKLEGDVYEVEDDDEGNTYISVKILERYTSELDVFLKVYELRQENINEFLLRTKGY